MYIDTHTHIYLKQFDEDIKEAIERCQLSSVDALYMPNIDVSSINRVKKLSEQYPKICKPMMGLHPCSVKEDYQEQLGILRKELDGSTKYIAVGEIGIDLYWDKTFVEQQKEAFSKQIDWALELDIPIVIHSRDSLDITISTVSDMQNGKLRGVFHCFNGTVDQGKQIQDLGFYMGIGGVVTFKNAGVDKVVSQLNISNMILETDSPYLAPVPYRGKRNESSYIPMIAEKLGAILDRPIEEIGKITTDNALRLFQL